MKFVAQFIADVLWVARTISNNKSLKERFKIHQRKPAYALTLSVCRAMSLEFGCPFA